MPQLLVHQAVHYLASKKPSLSACRVLTRGQRILAWAGFFAAIICFALMPSVFLILSGMVCMFFYLSCTLLRGLIIAAHQPPTLLAISSLSDVVRSGERYSVLVALYKEAGQVEQLVRALDRLNWPRQQIEIMLICEADDLETIHALRSITLPTGFDVLLVPPRFPRTKPKALNYALPLCSGNYVVLYDAEDRPHPDQLLEAHAIFARAKPELACLQAPLVIRNTTDSWLTRLFSIEYMTLFMGVLPVLAKWHAPMPLGGTSNHIKMQILRKLGGWDPFNVTEDADLGIRLARSGYWCDVMVCPTWEEAPNTMGNWLPQRTRWLKGWMQTILVHTRNPAQLRLELGTSNTLLFYLLLVAVVISALVHPLFLCSAIWFVPYVLSVDVDAATAIVLLLSIFNLIGGYSTYAILALHVRGQNRGGQNRGGQNRRLQSWHFHVGWLLFLPFYWLLISVAAWRALWQLFWAPHNWEKTKHIGKD